MTTSFYLEHYLDSLESLPGELRRNFTLMHDMDDKNRNILRDVDAASDDYLRKVCEIVSNIYTNLSAGSIKIIYV